MNVENLSPDSLNKKSGNWSCLREISCDDKYASPLKLQIIMNAATNEIVDNCRTTVVIEWDTN